MIGMLAIAIIDMLLILSGRICEICGGQKIELREYLGLARVWEIVTYLPFFITPSAKDGIYLALVFSCRY